MLAYRDENDTAWLAWDGKRLPVWLGGVAPPSNAEQVMADPELAALGLARVVQDEIPAGQVVTGWTLIDVDGAPHYSPVTVDAPPAAVPEVVTNFQARAALMGAGLFDAVDQAIKNSGNPVAVQAWEYANEVTRGGALVSEMAVQLAISDEAMDDLFRAAAVIEA
jgi:hypothetical protein